MDKKHTIDGTGPRSADILVCGLRRLLVAGSRLVTSRTTRPLRHGTGKSHEPPGWKAYTTRPTSHSADVLVCGFSELPSSEFPPPPFVAASLVSAAKSQWSRIQTMAPEKMNRSQRRKTFPVRPLLTSFPSVQESVPICVLPSRGSALWLKLGFRANSCNSCLPITHHPSNNPTVLSSAPHPPSAGKTQRITKKHKESHKYNSTT
jgi:hypothetical protein